jgi:hypothetical protein
MRNRILRIAGHPVSPCGESQECMGAGAILKAT